MNKKLYIGIILITCFNLCGCDAVSEDKILKSLPNYENKEVYYKEGVGDYTDYCKYFYLSDITDSLKNNSNFVEVSLSDTEVIYQYFSDFEEWVSNCEYYDKYDFDIDTQINIGDFYCLKTMEGQEVGQSKYKKYDNYSLYYFDIDKNILYYIHNNI